MQTADAALQQRAESARLGAIEVLRGYPEVRVVDAPGADVSAFTATVRGDAAAPQLVPPSGAPVALADASSGIQSIVGWISRDLKVSHPMGGTPDAYNALADAAAAMNAHDDAKAETARRNLRDDDPLAALIDDIRGYVAYNFDRAPIIERLSGEFERTQAGLSQAPRILWCAQLARDPLMHEILRRAVGAGDDRRPAGQRLHQRHPE